MLSDTRWRILDFMGNVKLFAIITTPFLLLILYWLANWPSGEPKYLSGTVISTGPVSVASLAGGTAQGITVRLTDGRTILVVHGPHARLLKQGDPVRIFQQDSLFAPPAFGIADSP